MASILVEVDMERPKDARDMKMGKALALLAKEMCQDDAHVGTVLALAIATHAKEAGLLADRDDKIAFADGWGKMLAFAVQAVCAND